jgi:hypothetical protein
MEIEDWMVRCNKDLSRMLTKPVFSNEKEFNTVQSHTHYYNNLIGTIIKHIIIKLNIINK